MKKCLLFLFVLLCFAAHSSAAEEIKRLPYPTFELKSSTVIDQLQSDESIYEFTLKHVRSNLKNAAIKYSLDGNMGNTTLDNFSFQLSTIPGKHQIVLYLNEEYFEVQSDSLEILPKHFSQYDVHMESSLMPVICDKPVIYLYPENVTKVHVEVEPTGEMQFTYPKYNHGWSLIAEPNGTLHIDSQTYNYLFWESQQLVNINHLGRNGGFNVDQTEILAFLESKLDIAGFSSKEKADFITYWAPRMIQYEKVFVEFIQDEACDQFANLDITPEPDHINRFYMNWTPINTDFPTFPQRIDRIDRSGFSVLEWGGQFIEPFTNQPKTLETL